jgi:hypothetical protein
MRLLIGASILEREFGAAIPLEHLVVLRRAARVPLLADIKGAGLPAQTKLLKGYATSGQGPRRLVCLLATASGDLFLLFYRPKGDSIGDNISIKNPAFIAALRKHLTLLQSDIAERRIQEII